MAAYEIATDDFVQAMGLLAKAFSEDPQTQSLGYVRVVSHEGMTVLLRRPPASWKPKKRHLPPEPLSTVWDRLTKEGSEPEPEVGVEELETKPPARSRKTAPAKPRKR